LRLFVGLSLASLMVVGCGGGGSKQTAEPAKNGTPPSTAESDAGGDVIATFGGKQLTSGQIMKEMERLPTPSRAYLNAPERKRQFVDNMILNDLLYDEGKKAGYDTDPDVDRQVNDLRKRLVVQRVMRKYQTPPEISDEKAKAYYDENPNLYSS